MHSWKELGLHQHDFTGIKLVKQTSAALLKTGLRKPGLHYQYWSVQHLIDHILQWETCSQNNFSALGGEVLSRSRCSHVLHVMPLASPCSHGLKMGLVSPLVLLVLGRPLSPGWLRRPWKTLCLLNVWLKTTNLLCRAWHVLRA